MFYQARQEAPNAYWAATDKTLVIEDSNLTLEMIQEKCQKYHGRFSTIEKLEGAPGILFTGVKNYTDVNCICWLLWELSDIEIIKMVTISIDPDDSIFDVMQGLKELFSPQQLKELGLEDLVG